MRRPSGNATTESFRVTTFGTLVGSLEGGVAARWLTPIGAAVAMERLEPATKRAGAATEVLVQTGAVDSDRAPAAACAPAADERRAA